MIFIPFIIAAGGIIYIYRHPEANYYRVAMVVVILVILATGLAKWLGVKP